MKYRHRDPNLNGLKRGNVNGHLKLELKHDSGSGSGSDVLVLVLVRILRILPRSMTSKIDISDFRTLQDTFGTKPSQGPCHIDLAKLHYGPY